MLGIIVDQNDDVEAIDTWALVVSGAVTNLAVGNAAYAVAAKDSYDYMVDITNGGQSAQIGDLYDPESDTFSAPPNPYIETVTNDIISLMMLLSDALADAANLESDEFTTAYSDFLASDEGSFTPNEAAVMSAIYTYLASGG